MPETASGLKYVWLDSDPGHDDATAIMLAVHFPNIHLLGVSTTHGNTTSDATAINAAKCLVAFGAPPHVLVYPGALKPLLLPARHDAEIHGPDGLGGVEGLPVDDHPDVLARFVRDSNGTPIRALEAMAKSIKETWKKGSGQKVSVISSGPMTNIALFISVYPDLLEGVEEFVFLGGGVGLGNRSSVAEFNILCDPHAAQIVLDAPVKTVMIPINVSHTAIVTKQIRAELLAPGVVAADGSLPPPLTKLRHTLSTLISHFADAYEAVFGFNDGPPLHDALTVGYVAFPELFNTARHRVDIELTGTHCTGETVVDMYKYRSCDDTWGPSGRNCLVAQSVQADKFFNLLLECVSRCDTVSPLNAAA